MIEFLNPDRLRLRASGKWVDYDEDVLPSNPAEMDFGIAPCIEEAVREVVEHQRYGYASHKENGPTAQLAECFVRRMKNKYDWEIESENVIILSNLVQATMAGITAFSDKGEGIALQVPAYPMFLKAIEQAGRRPVYNVMPIKDGRFELDMDDFEAKLSDDVKVLILCHPQNPTGRVLTKDDLAPIAKLAIEKDFIIISDEIHADIIFDDHKHIPFLKMFPECADRTITLYSASKGFNMPGLRCAMMHFGTKELMERFTDRVPPMLLGNVGLPGIVGTIAAWEKGDEWFRDALAQIEKNRNHMIERFEKEMPEVAMLKPEATYLAWANFSECSLPDRPYDYLLKEARVAGGDGAMFGPGYEKYVRFNFATSPEILDEKIDRVFRCLNANKA